MKPVSPGVPRNSSFAVAFWGLPSPQRRALSALYSFCRTVDDIVDQTTERAHAVAEIGHWRSVLDRIEHPSLFDSPVAHDLSRAVKSFPIQVDDLRWILEGVETDLYKFRYATFEELLAYCDGVASAVGLASMAIFGADRARTYDYAMATGRALQLTNILRDVRSDAKRGRIYVPQEDFTRFGYRERDLLLSSYNDRFIALMDFEVSRARTYYEASRAALPEAERRKYPAAELMRQTYELLLKRIERRRFNVFDRKIRVPVTRKVALALTVWMRHYVRAAQP